MAEYIDRKKVEKKVLGLTIVDPAVAPYADAVLLSCDTSRKPMLRRWCMGSGWRFAV